MDRASRLVTRGRAEKSQQPQSRRGAVPETSLAQDTESNAEHSCHQNMQGPRPQNMDEPEIYTFTSLEMI